MKNLKTILLVAVLSLSLGISTISTVVLANTPITASNEELGGNENGFYYGLIRGSVVLSHQGKYTVLIQKAEKISDLQYKVTFKSTDRSWANGDFIVDILPWDVKNQRVLDGYQVWFGYYNKEKQPIGCAQMKKIKY